MSVHQEPRQEDYDHLGMFQDDWRAWDNEAKHGKDALCGHCLGCGNELLTMFRKCPECNGTGLRIDGAQTCVTAALESSLPREEAE